MSANYDNTVRIGYGALSLPNSHAFFRAAVAHDGWYDRIMAGDSDKTLKEVDKEFYRNCMRIAASEAWRTKSPVVGFKLAMEARLFYKIVRYWAKYMRPELEAYRPKQE